MTPHNTESQIGLFRSDQSTKWLTARSAFVQSPATLVRTGSSVGKANRAARYAFSDKPKVRNFGSLQMGNLRSLPTCGPRRNETQELSSPFSSPAFPVPSHIPRINRGIRGVGRHPESHQTCRPEGVATLVRTGGYFREIRWLLWVRMGGYFREIPQSRPRSKPTDRRSRRARLHRRSEASPRRGSPDRHSTGNSA